MLLQVLRDRDHLHLHQSSSIDLNEVTPGLHKPERRIEAGEISNPESTGEARKREPLCFLSPRPFALLLAKSLNVNKSPKPRQLPAGAEAGRGGGCTRYLLLCPPCPGAVLNWQLREPRIVFVPQKVAWDQDTSILCAHPTSSSKCQYCPTGIPARCVGRSQVLEPIQAVISLPRLPACGPFG